MNKTLIKHFKAGQSNIICDIFDNGELHLQIVDPQMPMIVSLKAETAISIMENYCYEFLDDIEDDEEYT